MEIGEIIEIGDRKIEVTPRREETPTPAPRELPTPERVKEPAHERR